MAQLGDELESHCQAQVAHVTDMLQQVHSLSLISRCKVYEYEYPQEHEDALDRCRSDIESLLEARTADEARLQAQWLEARSAQQAALEEARGASEAQRLAVNARCGDAAAAAG